MTQLRAVLTRRATRAAGLLLLGLAACDGSNAWTELPTGGAGRRDGARPTVRIELPDSALRVAVHDSVLVRVRVSDDVALDSLTLSGFALRGSPTLGTQTRVDRFETKTVKLRGVGGAAVRDTVILRYLVATSDSLQERPVYLVASARDTVGNVRADTVRIGIGGPRVQIVAPAAQSELRAGSQLRVRIAAEDTLQRVKEVVVRARQAFSADTTLRLEPALGRVDTVVVLNVPASAQGELRLQAVVRTLTNDSSATQPTVLRVVAGSRDQTPPTVRFQVTAPARAELSDSVAVTVVATDSLRVGRVGATIVATHRLVTGTVALAPLSLTAVGDSATFRVALGQLGLPQPTDTSTVRLEVTGFATDTAGNCATATVPGTSLSESCRTENGITLGTRAGARTELVLVRGATVRPAASADVLVDLASDGRRIFVSNRTQNRVEMLPVGATDFAGSIPVGSQPWGMALSPDSTRLYVANSGGTNISVVDLTAAAPREIAAARIQTPNIRVFLVPFTVDTVDINGGRAPRQIPTKVTKFDYSDRPQFIAHTATGQLFYSTRPTGAAPTGTIRRYDLASRKVEIFTDYVENQVRGQVVVLNADSVKLLESLPAQLVVYPRPLPGSSDPNPVFVGYIEDVISALSNGGYDTRFQYFLDIEELGLSDTTFVAVSRDHRAVAFGEGARSPGRIILFKDVGAGITRQGEVRDLVNNAAERVTSLALNRDGSLGIARGTGSSFVFDDQLRLRGSGIGGGQATGGVEMHPGNPEPQRAFVSGTEGGLAFIDVIDTFHFRRVGRIFIRDTVTGPVRAVRTADGTLKLYALTSRGIVAVDVRTEDLREDPS